MIKMSKFYGILRGHARVQLTDKKGRTIYYDGSLNSMPDTFGDWTVIDFEVSNDLTYRFVVKQ